MSKEIAEEIRIKLKKEERNLSWLARQIGITKYNMWQIMKKLEDGGSISYDKLDSIGKALGIKFKLGA
jgi:DNA-binding phage protein